ncbi:radical SAM protein [Methanobacterium sp. CWC-01]|uniref:radical SAM protein n=1 Tax=Methanobacterium aridiramus TaxID=2584467 RepID=UPI002577FB97|nr:radical SAM protein [Methanobacterium sp. CWC-01]
MADFVINPYVGCSHGCLYCYARFMKRFTGHREGWGEFLDVKVNADTLVPKRGSYQGKRIFLSSVTDPYLPQEREYKLTRRILDNLVPLEPSLNILTKSDLVLRDLDLIKQFPEREIGFSFSTLEENLRRQLERRANPVKKRLDALRMVHRRGVRNYLFISPIFPFLTDWKAIIRRTRNFVDYYLFENLNVAGSVWGPVKRWIELEHPHLAEAYHDIYFGDSPYWEELEGEIMDYGHDEGLEFQIYFHH